MRSAGLCGRMPKRWRTTTVPDPPADLAAGRIRRDFTTCARGVDTRWCCCGRRYVGTAAHGRYKSHRYYTCWSHARYGTKADCDIHRFPADEIETAIGTALLQDPGSNPTDPNERK